MWAMAPLLRALMKQLRPVGPAVLKQEAPCLEARGLPAGAGMTCGFSQLQQQRNVFVEVKNGDFDRALKRYKWKLRDDNSMRMLRARQYNYKPAELKVLFRKEGEIRRRTKEMKAKIDWVLSKKTRGF